MQTDCEKSNQGKTGVTNLQMDLSEPKSTPNFKL